MVWFLSLVKERCRVFETERLFFSDKYYRMPPMFRRVHSIKYLHDVRKELRNRITPQEKLLWCKLKNNQLGYKFRRQHSIGHFITDFYCAEKKLVIELDGGQHLDNQEYDQERSEYFESLNIRVIRFWNDELNTNIDGVVMKIEKELIKQANKKPALWQEGFLSASLHRSQWLLDWGITGSFLSCTSLGLLVGTEFSGWNSRQVLPSNSPGNSWSTSKYPHFLHLIPLAIFFSFHKKDLSSI